MIYGIVSHIINGAIDQVIDILKSKLENYIDNRNKDASWNRIIEETIMASEGIDKEIMEYIFSRLPIVNFKNHLFDKKYNNIHRNFILNLAMELCKFDKEKYFSISLGAAVIDKWMEQNEKSLDRYSYNVKELNVIINDREKLYCSYFKLFEDKNGIDKIRIYYPKNGETWISWDDKYSIDINVNLSKGLSYGFWRVGFDYMKICDDNNETLKYAYIENEKEISRFNYNLREKNNMIICLR